MSDFLRARLLLGNRECHAMGVRVVMSRARRCVARLLGDQKTWRGLAGSVVACALVAFAGRLQRPSRWGPLRARVARVSRPGHSPVVRTLSPQEKRRSRPRVGHATGRNGLVVQSSSLIRMSFLTSRTPST